MNSTPRFGLPFLAVGQSQKELVHNEALQTLDSVVCAAVEEPPLDVPPSAPLVGSSYVVGDTPTGDWAGNPQYLATFTDAGWKLVAPREGMSAYVRSTRTYVAYRAGTWELGQLRGSTLIIGGQQVVGARAAAIVSASGGTTVDAEARAAIDQVLAALRQHGLIES